VNCQEARLHIGAEPNAVSPELAEHLERCPECRQFQREMIALEANIRRALDQPPLGQSPAAQSSVVPLSAHVRSRPTRRFAAWSGWALAASILVMTVTTLAVWTVYPTQTLAHDVVMHVEGEPKSWTSSEQTSPATLNDILRPAGVELDTASGDVMYARSCLFRGHKVPHLVVKTSRGPVTVLVLRYEHVKAREHFHEDGMSGVIAPAPHGSIAVLAQGNADINDVAEQIQRSVHWLPDSR
jgi:hypothetical protein